MLVRRSSRAKLVAAALLLPPATSACSGEDDDSGSESECSSLRPEGPIVDQAIDYGGIPAAVSGGAIVDGHYVLSAATAFVPENSLILLDCNGVQAALNIQAGRFAFALGCYFDAADSDSFLGGALSAGTYATADTDLTFTYSCPEEFVETFQYSVEPPNLRFLIPEQDDPGTTELVWTLSP